jgi:site-specific DNA-methyltransferase (adenine-specific)/modification methylase
MIFSSGRLFGKYHEMFDPLFDTFQYLVWHKTNPTPHFRKTSFLSSVELIVCLWNKGHTWNFGKQTEMHNFFESPICMGAERLKNPAHPTQKPVKLLEHLVRIASNENDIVFDPFMGVGSTGIASIKNNRNFIGIERDELYYHGADSRIKNYINNNLVGFFCNKVNVKYESI